MESRLAAACRIFYWRSKAMGSQNLEGADSQHLCPDLCTLQVEERYPFTPTPQVDFTWLRVAVKKDN